MAYNPKDLGCLSISEDKNLDNLFLFIYIEKDVARLLGTKASLVALEAVRKLLESYPYYIECWKNYHFTYVSPNKQEIELVIVQEVESYTLKLKPIEPNPDEEES